MYKLFVCIIYISSELHQRELALKMHHGHGLGHHLQAGHLYLHQ